MMEIRTVGDEVLRRQAKPVKAVTAAVRRLLDEMALTMRAEEGIGLAAPQVGVTKRILVADIGEGLIELINPVILHAEGYQLGLEACLSIPDVVGEVERSENIRLTGMNRDGHQIWMEASGLLARCLQHEIDHLDGILFTDRAIRILSEEEMAARNEVVLD
ncbi:MAG: peptide deformylase [Sulfobacillus sp.]